MGPACPSSALPRVKAKVIPQPLGGWAGRRGGSGQTKNWSPGELGVGGTPGTPASPAEGGAAGTPLALASPSGWPCLPSASVPVDPRAAQNF